MTSNVVAELEAAKEILSDLCDDIGSFEVDEMIRLRMERWKLTIGYP